MEGWHPADFTGRHIIVADEDPQMVEFIIRTLRADGHAVFHAYDVLSATQLAIGLENCDLVISNTKVEGADGVKLIQYLRKRLPALPIIYLANTGRSTPEVEAQLPANVPILPLHDREHSGHRGGDAGWQARITERPGLPAAPAFLIRWLGPVTLRRWLLQRLPDVLPLTGQDQRLRLWPPLPGWIPLRSCSH
jgi:CheY-like chemotaxis protein